MRRWIAILWHASFLLLAGGLYFFFVLPRWYELVGTWSPTLGTVLRIVCGVLLGLAALPVVFTWTRSRKPENGTPQLALTLRVWSIVLHVLAGVLIAGAAISEIWLSLDRFGQYLFGIYGAAAAVALLGAFGFYLAFVAELPPPPPKPLKPKKQRRGRTEAPVEEAAPVGTAETETSETAETETEPSEPSEPSEDPAETPAEQSAEAADGNAEDADSDKESEEPAGRLRNRRPGGKASSRLFRRSRGGVALDD
jgi:MFS family permease